MTAAARPGRPTLAAILAALLAAPLAAPLACGTARAQEPDVAPAPPSEAAPAAKPPPKPRPPRTKPPRPKPPESKPEVPPAAAPAPAAQPPALPLESYVDAATTTIIAEQSCPGVRLNAGQLTNLRLAARVAPAQEGSLEERLRARSVEVRGQLAMDGREAWCAAALDAYGPAGTRAKGLLAPPPR